MLHIRLDSENVFFNNSNENILKWEIFYYSEALDMYW